MGTSNLSSSQILIWERSTRLEAGLKREFAGDPYGPELRTCRLAKHVLEKRRVLSPAVLVLDAAKLKTWIVEANEPSVLRVRQSNWRAVIAVVADESPLDWRWTATGITGVLAGPIRDTQIAAACKRALTPTSHPDISIADRLDSTR